MTFLTTFLGNDNLSLSFIGGTGNLMRSLIKKICILTLVFAIYTAVAVPAALCDEATVRVGLTRFGKPKEVQIKALSGNLSIKSSSLDSCLPYGKTAVVSATQAGIEVQIGSDSVLQAGDVITISSDELSSGINVTVKGISSKSYLGSLEISCKSGVLQLVNIVGLEDYLAGVLPAEMPDSYPLEALKAQAVAARTYTLRNMSKHSSSGYSLCDSSHCQVYSGIAAGKSRCLQAVNDTRDMVLAYNGELADVLYSADGGGYTQNYSEIYPGKNLPYLCGVKDPDDIYHTSWNKAYSIDELSGKLVKAGIKEAAGLKSIDIDKSGTGNRVLSVKITGASSETTITTSRLKNILGYEAIKSNLFTIDSSRNETIEFIGKGFGHGVGLCQVGAKGLAQSPYKYSCDQILTHYFPGTQVSLLSSLGTQADVDVADADPVVLMQNNEHQIQKQNKPKPSGSGPSSDKDIPFDVRVAAPDPL